LRDYYNTVRPHWAKKRKTPQVAFDARVKARPSGTPIRDAGEFRIRFDKVSHGKVTLRYGGQLRHLGVVQAHNGRRVVLLVDDRNVRVHSVDGEFLRELRIDPAKIYQGQSTSGCPRCLATAQSCRRGDSSTSYTRLKWAR